MSEKDNSVPPLSFEIERQARIKRSVVIQSCVRGTMRAFAEWFRTFVLKHPDAGAWPSHSAIHLQ